MWEAYIINSQDNWTLINSILMTNELYDDEQINNILKNLDKNL